MREVYLFKPLSTGLRSLRPSMQGDSTSVRWGSKNFRIKQQSIQNRYGYSLDRTLSSMAYNIAYYKEKDGTTHTLYLTETDLCHREASGTWSYKTETYTTGNVTDISGKTVTGSGTSWDTCGIASGDYFLLDDDHSSTNEPDSSWREIDSVDSGTQITLVNDYEKNVSSVSKSYKVRQIYSVPSNERWSYAIVDDKFCFTNGDVDVQYWDGSGYASALDSTYAKNARYAVSYANRLILGDLIISGTRDPLGIRTSKEGDPTDYTDNTQHDYQFLDSTEFVTGLGVVGNSIIIYRTDSYKIGHRTGKYYNPLSFTYEKYGKGLIAPYSLVPAFSTNFWLGRDDFYVMQGNNAVSIGKEVRNIFFQEVNAKEAELVFGFNDILRDEVLWRATTSEGVFWFVFNYKDKKWQVYEYADNIYCGGRGII